MKNSVKKYVSALLILLLVFALASCGEAEKGAGSVQKMDTYVGPVEAYAEYMMEGIKNNGSINGVRTLEYIEKQTKGVCQQEFTALKEIVSKSDVIAPALAVQQSEADKICKFKITKKEAVSEEELTAAAEEIFLKIDDILKSIEAFEARCQKDENLYKTAGKKVHLNEKQTMELVADMKAVALKVKDIKFTNGYTLTVQFNYYGSEITDEFVMPAYEANGYWVEGTVYTTVINLLTACIGAID